MATIQVALGFELFLVTIGWRTHTAVAQRLRLPQQPQGSWHHCHCGSVAGQSFSSKEEMLKKLSENTDRKAQTDVKK